MALGLPRGWEEGPRASFGVGFPGPPPETGPECCLDPAPCGSSRSAPCEPALRTALGHRQGVGRCWTLVDSVALSLWVSMWGPPGLRPTLGSSGHWGQFWLVTLETWRRVGTVGTHDSPSARAWRRGTAGHCWLTPGLRRCLPGSTRLSRGRVPGSGTWGPVRLHLLLWCRSPQLRDDPGVPRIPVGL